MQNILRFNPQIAIIMKTIPIYSLEKPRLNSLFTTSSTLTFDKANDLVAYKVRPEDTLIGIAYYHHMR